METTEKCKNYVASQSEAYANAIEKAYMQGYNDAVEENSKEHIKVVEDGVEYLDFGLKSGTLWAFNRTKFVSYSEAQKLNIPTKEQVEELAQYFRWRKQKCGNYDSDWRFYIIDKNGKEYRFCPAGYTQGSGMDPGKMYMWYRAELTENGEALVYELCYSNMVNGKAIFPGYKAFAFFVK